MPDLSFLLLEPCWQRDDPIVFRAEFVPDQLGLPLPVRHIHQSGNDENGNNGDDDPKDVRIHRAPPFS